MLHLPEIFAHWPHAQVVHLIRDPRDVLASLREARKKDQLEEFAALWCRFFGAVERFKLQARPSEDRFLEIRYENVVMAPERSMARLLRFLGEPWEESVARFEGHPKDFTRVKEATGKESTTLDRLSDPLSDQRIGIWRSVLLSDEPAALFRLVSECGLGPRYEQVVASTPVKAIDSR